MPVVTQVTPYGYRAVLSDPLTLEDIQEWTEAVRGVVADQDGFGQLVDIRGADRTRRDPQVAQAVHDAMMLIRGSGLRRTAVIVPDQVTARRLMRVACRYAPETGERFIDARDQEWERAAVAWIVHGIEPHETLASLDFLRRAAGGRY